MKERKAKRERPPGFFKEIRKKRMSYPPHIGQFTKNTSRAALERRWQKKSEPTSEN